MIRIISVGKAHSGWLIDAIERYEKRLQQPYDVTWELIASSRQSDTRARQEESQKILAKCRQDDFVVLLDERGNNISSPSLSELLEGSFASGRKMTFIIGGAYGVSNEMLERANYTWSLSKLVFPHQIVRLLLIEQLYRAQTIARQLPYHHM